MSKHELVMSMVRRELARNPEIGSTELYRRAKKLDRSIGRLSLRQFHAGYPLQAAREQRRAEADARRRREQRRQNSAPVAAAAESSPSSEALPADVAAAEPETSSEAMAVNGPVSLEREITNLPVLADRRSVVRGILTEFAREVVAAESKSDFVALFSSIDQRTHEVLHALGNQHR